MNNEYFNAMEHCVPPEGLEERLRARVLAAAPGKGRTVRPWSLARRAALAALVAGVLAVTAGAAVLVDWDAIFADRFGEEAASAPAAESAFQEVGVTSVCDEVTLTVRQALGDSKTIYIILDYQLPESVDSAAVAAAWDGGENFVGTPQIQYAAGDVAWEELKEADGGEWKTVDWTDYTSYAGYLNADPLEKFHFPGGSNSKTESVEYSAETNTLTYLLRYNIDTEGKNLTDQPLTLLATPPTVTVDGKTAALADHPAVITFRPEYSAKARTLELEDKATGLRVQAVLSPLSLSVEVWNGSYTVGALARDITLRYKDGTREKPAWDEGVTGSTGGRTGEIPSRAQVSRHFRDILDLSRVEAVCVGDWVLPLRSAE